MKGEELFDVLAEVDEALLPHIQKKISASQSVVKNEDTAEPHRRQIRYVFGGIAVACLCCSVLAVMILSWVFSRPNEWGTSSAPVWTGGCVIWPPDHTHPEDTYPNVDPSNPNEQFFKFKVFFNSMDEYQALVEKLTLPDEELIPFLEEKGYSDMGLVNREQLETLEAIMSDIPIPHFVQEQPRKIIVDNYSSVVYFEFLIGKFEIKKIPSSLAVEQDTSQLSLVWQYTKHPLYLSSISETGDGVTGRYVANVSGHKVSLQLQVGDEDELLQILEDLDFAYLSE